jgi:hypothetical protein
MSLPTINDLQAVDPVLTNILVGYDQSEDRFIADRIFPAVPSEKDSATFYKFDKRYWMNDEMVQRAPGGPYARGDFGVSTDTFTTKQWALGKDIADEERSNSQLPMDLETAAVKWLGLKRLIRKERLFSAAAFVTSVWDTDNTTANDWDDYSISDPVSDIITAKMTVSNNTGLEPNTMAMGYIVYAALENHPDLIDRIKNTQAVTMANVRAALASIFDVASFLVGKATYNATNEASAMTTGTAIIDDDCLVCHVDPSAGVFGATAGKTFFWNGGGGMGVILRNRVDERDSDLIKSKAQFVHKVVASDLGYFFSDIV